MCVIVKNDLENCDNDVNFSRFRNNSTEKKAGTLHL